MSGVLATAQLDLTGSGPDSTGLEQASCPFHSGPGPTLMIDHLRQAFMCAQCRASGPFVVQDVAGKRIVILSLARYLPLPNGLQKQADTPRLNNVTLLRPRAGLSRQSFRNAVTQLAPDQPLYLAAFPALIPDGFMHWLAVHSPITVLWPLPAGLLRSSDAWALIGAQHAVVSGGERG